MRCIQSENSENRLTSGKEYTVIEQFITTYKIIDNKGFLSNWFKNRFVEVKESYQIY